MTSTILTLDATGSRVSLKVGDTLELTLPENPSTGYRWEIVSTPSILEESLSDQLDLEGRQPGAAGRRTFRFRVSGSGDGDLRLRLRRPWEPEGMDEGLFELTLSSATE